MKKSFNRLTLLSILLFFLNIAYGFPDIIRLPQVLSQLKKQSTLPVFFPDKIPVHPAGPVYASLTSYGIHPDYNQFWQINVDSTPNCYGVKICNIGYVSAEKNRKLTLEYQTLPGNQTHRKEPLIINDHLTVYFTPFHIQAGGVNPTLEWQQNNVLYTLSWRISADPTEQKKILSKMIRELYNTRS